MKPLELELLEGLPLWASTAFQCMVQALLGEWRAELARKPLSMTEADACQVLGVSPNEQGHVDEEALKAAYRCG